MSPISALPSLRNQLIPSWRRRGEAAPNFATFLRKPSTPWSRIAWKISGGNAVEIVDALPLNATGKVMKETLRERASMRAAGGAR